METSGGRPCPFLLGLSGTADDLVVFVRAIAATAGLDAQPRLLPFGTLRQHLHVSPPGTESEVILLLPWDLAPECDWRTGFPENADLEAVIGSAAAMVEVLSQRKAATYLYLPAALPPVFLGSRQRARFAAALLGKAMDLGARILPADLFDLGAYLSTGRPISGAKLDVAATAIVDCLKPSSLAPAKVLVTDLDNVLWSGVIAEDGVDGIEAGPSGRGYRHYVYQSFLLSRQRAGVILAGVSRNSPADAVLPFERGLLLLGKDDFVDIRAGYRAKSVEVAEIARSLNLSLESFVFVDDNPVEIAEVTAALPTVRCLQFPAAEADLPGFLDRLADQFDIAEVTAEDRARTRFYKSRAATLSDRPSGGGDTTAFLRSLGMRLTVVERGKGDWTRAIQLINKTNQFNLNGRRWPEVEVEAVTASGGTLYAGSLEDRSGSHGEIVACLVNFAGCVQAFVMSCRVFERKVEHAFLAWLLARQGRELRLSYEPTARNQPFTDFISLPGFLRNGDVVTESVRLRPELAIGQVIDVVPPP